MLLVNNNFKIITLKNQLRSKIFHAESCDYFTVAMLDVWFDLGFLIPYQLQMQVAKTRMER